MVVVIYIARAQQLLVRMEPLQIINCFILYSKVTFFFHLNVVTMLFLSAHRNS